MCTLGIGHLQRFFKIIIIEAELFTLFICICQLEVFFPAFADKSVLFSVYCQPQIVKGGTA